MPKSRRTARPSPAPEARAAHAPESGRLARALPPRWQKVLLARAQGLDAGALVADLLLTYPTDDRGFDPARTRRSFFLVERTICRYFRLQVLGAGRIPPGRALVIGCHSGVLPWDAACLVTALYRHTGRFPRAAGHALWGAFAPVARFLAARGVVLGSAAELEALLRREELVVLFPGGAEDMRRPIWRERYLVKPHKGFARGRGGYVKMALRTRTPIVPVAIIGAEEVHGLLADVRPVARLLRFPYFPIVLSTLPLPARIYIRFGEPIRLEAPPAAAEDQAVVDRLNIRVRRTLQALIDDTVRHRRGIFWSSYEGPD
jgi:1-acyl-sn-glycerol-3-phosphate acyltransferase